MKHLEQLVTMAATAGIISPQMVKDVKDELAEIERGRDTMARRYANLVQEHIDTTKRERGMTHVLHKLKLAIGADKAANAEPKLTPEFQTWLDGWTP